MPDEDLMRPILDAQKGLQPLIYAAEAARRCLQPFDDAAMRMIEQSRGLEEALKKARLFDTHALLLRESEWARQFREIEARFRLPEVPEILSLLRENRAYPVPDGVAALFKESDATRDLQKTMADIHTPWLDIHEKVRSMTGFGERQSIGRA